MAHSYEESYSWIKGCFLWEQHAELKAGPLEYTAELTSGDRNQVRDTEGRTGRNKCTPGALWVMELACATMGQCQIIERHI